MRIFKKTGSLQLAGVLVLLSLFVVAPAMAAEKKPVLKLYNWGNYTNPILVEKFEKETGIDLIVGGFDSNETMLAKIQAGGSGYDLAVPSDYMVAILRKEGLLQKIDKTKLPNFTHVEPRWFDVYWDEGREYSVPWNWGTTAFAVNTNKYKGDIHTLKILFDPPPSLSGRINMLDDMNEVINAGLRYLGYPRCNSNKDELREVYYLLKNAKKQWRTIDSAAMEKLTSGDVAVSQIWSGLSVRARKVLPSVTYAFPKEGFTAWMDNVVLLKSAKNVDNAHVFLNFIMEPENAALISDFTGYPSGIIGSDKFTDPVVVNAFENQVPDWAPEPEFVPLCEREVIVLYNKVWTYLKK